MLQDLLTHCKLNVPVHCPLQFCTDWSCKIDCPFQMAHQHAHAYPVKPFCVLPDPCPTSSIQA